MAKTSRFHPGFWFRRYVCFMAQRLPANNLIPLVLITAIIYGFTWGGMPVIKTICMSDVSTQLIGTFIPSPDFALSLVYYFSLTVLNLVGTIPLSRILQIYYPNYFDIYRDE